MHMILHLQALNVSNVTCNAPQITSSYSMNSFVVKEICMQLLPTQVSPIDTNLIGKCSFIVGHLQVRVNFKISEGSYAYYITRVDKNVINLSNVLHQVVLPCS